MNNFALETGFAMKFFKLGACRRHLDPRNVRLCVL